MEFESLLVWKNHVCQGPRVAPYLTDEFRDGDF